MRLYEEEFTMKTTSKKMSKKLMAGVGVLFAMIMYVNTVVAFASVTVSATAYHVGYGNVTGSQDLTDEDYNFECWVTLKTEIQQYTSGVYIYVNYNLAYNDTGASITGDVVSYTDKNWQHTAYCDLDNYGYYDDNADNLALFSAHYATGNGSMEPVYLVHVY